MSDESSHPIDQHSDLTDPGEGPSMRGEDDLLTAAVIATKLRAAGIGCEIVNLMPR